VVVSEITTGDHSKRADDRKGSRFGSAQRVLTIAVAHDLSLQSPRQIEVPCEHVAWIGVALARITVALVPARAASRIFAVLVVVRLPRIVTRTSTKLTRVVVIARTGVELLPVVIPIVVVGGTVSAGGSKSNMMAPYRLTRVVG
jgi:hypothetical protein